MNQNNLDQEIESGVSVEKSVLETEGDNKFVSISSFAFFLVAIAAILYFYSKPLPIATDNSIDNSAAEDSAFLDWAIYENNSYGFQFRYPKEFGVIKEASIINGIGCSDEALVPRDPYNDGVFLLAKADNMFVYISCNKLSQAVVDSFNNEPYWNDAVELVTVAGIDSYQHSHVTATGYEYKFIQIPVGDRYIQIGYIYGGAHRINSIGYRPSDAEWEGVLSSFQFSQAENTPFALSMQEYSNEQLGIKFVYPNNWNLKELISPFGQSIILSTPDIVQESLSIGDVEVVEGAKITVHGAKKLYGKEFNEYLEDIKQRYFAVEGSVKEIRVARADHAVGYKSEREYVVELIKGDYSVTVEFETEGEETENDVYQLFNVFMHEIDITGAEKSIYPTWNSVVRAVVDCKVESVSQNRLPEVVVHLKDGGILSAIEPEAGVLVRTVGVHKSRCGDVLIFNE